MTHKKYAVIVAGGKGTRFGSPIPKQFLELRGKPVLLHTLEAFYRYSSDIRIVVVLPGEDMRLWKEIAEKHKLPASMTVVEGGATRFQSVRNGLRTVADEALVAIHDGVRPLVSTDIIRASFDLAAIHQCAIAAVPLKESLRILADQSASGKTTAVDRTQYRIVQTPQTFRAGLIRKAYEMDEDSSLTDDASVAERAGHPIHLFDGDYRNLKITSREDLLIAEALMANAGGL